MPSRLLALARITLAALALALLAPAIASAQSAGTLVSATPAAGAPAGMRAWKVRYRTADQDGKAMTVTGMVVAPVGPPPARPRRVIVWTHGALGVAEKCAPSLMPAFYTITPGLAEMVRRGYVVVAPDYPGLAAPMPHPMLVGVDTARSVLDAVRAAGALKGAGAGRRYALWGESQGGHAALWTAIESAGYAPELTLVGTVASAPPTDLLANLREGADPKARALLTAFLTYTWSERFGAPLAAIFNRFNQGVVTRLSRNNCIQLDGGRPKLGTILGVVSVEQALKGKDLGAIEPWAGLAKANSVPARRVPAPLMIVQGGKDTIVAPAVTLDFARNVCRGDGALRYLFLPGADHPGGTREAATQSIDWIDARFAGKPPPNDCGKI